MTEAKICGLSRPEDVAAALEGGAAYLGFIFFPKSPRNVTPEDAAALAAPARGRARIVAVTVDAEDASLQEIARILNPDFVQLHGAESPERSAEVGRLTGAGVIKALPVSSREDLEAAKAYAAVADRLMFDAKPPMDATMPGGLGHAFDWTLLEGAAFGRPWFLAGGLSPDNVAEAVRLTGAPAVDVSSGVERAPGIKDPILIKGFLEAVRG
jgi:phosphoribosylanthranilate isomerase